MKKSLLIGVPMVLVGVALVVWFEPTHTIRGQVRGEPFFHDRSASYWASAVVSDDPLTRASGLERLEAGSAEAIPVLLHMLQSDRPDLRWTATDLLRKIGPPAAETIPVLLEHLNDPDPFVRKGAAAALAASKTKRPEVVQALLAKLKSNEPDIAIRPLSSFGAAAREGVPDLIAIAENGENTPARRREAMRTLGKIGPDAKPAVPLLIQALKDPEESIREYAAESLGEIGDAQAVPHLVAIVDDPTPKVRRNAIRALGQLGPTAKSAIPAIDKKLNDKEFIVREAAKVALRRIDPQRKS